MDFVPYIERLFPAMLLGINGEKASSRGKRWQAVQGPAATELLSCFPSKSMLSQQ